MSEKIRKPIDLFVVVFGCWTVYSHLAVYGGYSFSALLHFSFLPMVCAAGILFFLRRGPDRNTQAPAIGQGINLSSIVPWLVPLVVVAVILHYVGFYTLSWLLASAVLVWLTAAIYLQDNERSNINTPSANDRGHAAWLYLMMLLVSVIMTLTNMPNADDTYYVNAAITAQQYPQLALLSFDGIHGDLSIPTTHVAHRAQVYELFVAWVSQLTSQPVKDVYYILMPIVFSVLWVCANYLLCGVFSDRFRLLSLGFLLLLVHFWTERRLAYGNFSTTQLYLGKVVLLSVIVPALIYYCHCFVKKPDINNYLLLWLCCVVAVGISSTGIILGSVALFLAGLPWVLLGRQWRLIPWFAGLVVYPAVISLVVRREVGLHGGIASQGEVLPVDAVLGSDQHGAMVLMYLLLMPLFLSSLARDRRLLYTSAYILTCFLFLFSPWMGELIGNYSFQAMSWRVFWAMPIPVLLAVSLSHSGYFFFPGKKYLRALYYTVFCAIFASYGALNLLPGGRTFFPYLGYKQNPHLRSVAESLLACTTSEDTLLAPEGIAQVMASYKERPKLVGVGFNYLNNLQKFIPPDEVYDRQQLLAYAGNREADLSLETLGAKLSRYHVTQVVVFGNHPDVAALATRLPGLGYNYSIKSGDAIAWLQHPCGAGVSLDK